VWHHLPASTVPTADEAAANLRQLLANYAEMISAAEARGDAESVERLNARVEFFKSLR